MDDIELRRDLGYNITLRKGAVIMCSQAELNQITSELVQRYRQLFGEALREVVLYGSYARGDYDSESDVDVVGIVDHSREELAQSYRKLGELASDLSLEHGLTVSPTVVPLTDFTKYREALPYYRHIQEEGVRLDA